MNLPIRLMDGAIIRDRRTRWTHPATGEVYGGTDYDRADKLAEMGAEPHIDPEPEPAPFPTEAQIAEQKVALRASRYRNECDPHLLAVVGYDIEMAAEQDSAKRSAIATKRDKEAQNYLTKKAAIRAEVQ